MVSDAESTASIRHFPPNLLNNVEWLPLSSSNNLLCQKPTKPFVFSVLYLFQTKDFVATADNSILAIFQTTETYADRERFQAVFFALPTEVHIKIGHSLGVLNTFNFLEHMGPSPAVFPHFPVRSRRNFACARNKQSGS